MEGDEFSRRQIATSAYGKQIGANQQYLTGVQQGNLDRTAAERGGMIDIYFNTLGLGQQRESADQAYDLGRRSLRVARQAYQ